MKKILISGDSWGAGSEIAAPQFHKPESSKFKTVYVDHFCDMDEKNDFYRIPRIWPTLLSNKLNAPFENISYGGRDNANINLSIKNAVLADPEIDFVVVSWSQINRHIMYYQLKDDCVCYTHIFPHYQPNEDSHWSIRDYYKLFIGSFQNIVTGLVSLTKEMHDLHYFLKSKNIDHIFVNAFEDFNDDVKRINLADYIEYNKAVYKDNGFERKPFDSIIPILSQLEVAGRMWNDIDPYNFYRKSEPENTARDFMYKQLGPDDWKQGGHPSEAAHKLWANELYDYIKFRRGTS